MNVGAGVQHDRVLALADASRIYQIPNLWEMPMDSEPDNGLVSGLYSIAVVKRSQRKRENVHTLQWRKAVSGRRNDGALTDAGCVPAAREHAPVIVPAQTVITEASLLGSTRFIYYGILCINA